MADDLFDVGGDEGDLVGAEFLVGLFVELGGEDEFEEFFVGEVVAGGLDLLGVFGEVSFEKGTAAGAGLGEFAGVGDWQEVGDIGEVRAEMFEDFFEGVAFDGATDGVDGAEAVVFGGLLFDVGGEFNLGRGELIAAAVEVVVAGEVVVFLGVEAFGAVGLVEPDDADGVGVVADDAFGDGEVAAGGAGGFKVGDFAFDDDFAGLDVFEFGGFGEVFVGAGEVVEEVADGVDAGLS